MQQKVLTFMHSILVIIMVQSKKKLHLKLFQKFYIQMMELTKVED